MAEFELHIELEGRSRPVGLVRSNRVRGTEMHLFEYLPAWLDDPHRFSLEPVAMPAPAWWSAARSTLPRLLSDSNSRVELGTLSLDVAYDSEEVALIAARTTAGPRAVTRMRGPVRRVISIGDSVIQPTGLWRGALERAFSESGYYSDQVRAASLRSRARPTAARQAAL